MTRQRRSVSSLMAIAFTFAGFALAASTALADVTGGALNITAVNDAGDAATIQIALPAGDSPWVWSSNQTMEMRSETTGNLIAVLNPQGRESRVEYIDDPTIGLTFSAQAGPSTTTFFIGSALLTFPTLTAEGRASASFSLTDFNGDGATLTGVGDPGGSMGAYLAQYNGFAGTISGTTFAEVIQTMAAGSFSSSTANADVPAVGFQSIAAPVSDMSVLVSFRLTAFDLASGTSVYVIRQRPVATESATWSRIKTLIQ